MNLEKENTGAIEDKAKKRKKTLKLLVHGAS
jgi:hypothetical protein